jgi:hypothetical protein
MRWKREKEYHETERREEALMRLKGEKETHEMDRCEGDS